MYSMSDGVNPVNWMNLARVTRTFMIFLLSTELTVIQYQMINEQGFIDDEEGIDSIEYLLVYYI